MPPHSSEQPHPMASVVVPVFNSDALLPQLVLRLAPVLESQLQEYELILVDDDSRTGTWPVIEQLARRYDWVRGIRLLRNYGPILHKQAPGWSLYLLWPASLEEQRAMIHALDKKNVRWALVWDGAIDSQALRFRNSHPLVWRYLQRHFRRVRDRRLPPGFLLLHREEPRPLPSRRRAPSSALPGRLPGLSLRGP